MGLVSLFGGKKKPDALAAIYDEHLGDGVSPQVEPGEVQAYHFEPAAGEALHIYVTRGMSWRPQPEGDPDLRHVELILYTHQADPMYGDLVSKLSSYPWDTGSAFLGGDLLPLGSSAEVVVGSPRFGGLLVMASTRYEEHEFANALRALNPPVSPLQVIPLLADEFEYACKEGVEKLMERNNASTHTIHFDPQRESVLSDTEG
jgi:hypothetical protein